MPKGIPKNGVNKGRFKKGHIPWIKGRKVKKPKNAHKFPKGNKIRVGQIPWNKGKKGCVNSGSFKRKEKHWNWKGGKTKLIQAIKNLFQYKEWRAKIFQRDKWICQTYKKRSEGDLEAHHIIALSILIDRYKIRTIKQAIKCKELWDIKIGITLCRECHRLTKSYGRKKEEK